jgi:hypothetical protein
VKRRLQEPRQWALLAERPELPQARYLIGLPEPELVEQISKEPASTIVLYLSQFRDRLGGPYTPRDLLRVFSAVSSAPIYGVFETYLDGGIAGGFMESYNDLGRAIAERLIQLASGEPVPALSDVPEVCAADARALRNGRWTSETSPRVARSAPPSGPFAAKYFGRSSVRSPSCWLRPP